VRYVARMNTSPASPLDGVHVLLDLADERLLEYEQSSGSVLSAATLARARSAHSFLKTSLVEALSHPSTTPEAFHRAVFASLDRFTSALSAFSELPLSPAPAWTATFDRLRAFNDFPVASALLTALPMPETRCVVVLVDAVVQLLERRRELAAGKAMLLARYDRCVVERDAALQMVEHQGLDPQTRLVLQVARHLADTLHERYMLDGRHAVITIDEIALLKSMLETVTEPSVGLIPQARRPDDPEVVPIGEARRRNAAFVREHLYPLISKRADIADVIPIDEARARKLGDMPLEVTQHEARCRACERVVATCWLANGATLPVHICPACSAAEPSDMASAASADAAPSAPTVESLTAALESLRVHTRAAEKENAYLLARSVELQAELQAALRKVPSES